MVKLFLCCLVLPIMMHAQTLPAIPYNKTFCDSIIAAFEKSKMPMLEKNRYLNSLLIFDSGNAFYDIYTLPLHYYYLHLSQQLPYPNEYISYANFDLAVYFRSTDVEAAASIEYFNRTLEITKALKKDTSYFYVKILKGEAYGYLNMYKEAYGICTEVIAEMEKYVNDKKKLSTLFYADLLMAYSIAYCMLPKMHNTDKDLQNYLMNRLDAVKKLANRPLVLRMLFYYNLAKYYQMVSNKDVIDYDAAIKYLKTASVAMKETGERNLYFSQSCLQEAYHLFIKKGEYVTARDMLKEIQQEIDRSKENDFSHKAELYRLYSNYSEVTKAPAATLDSFNSLIQTYQDSAMFFNSNPLFFSQLFSSAEGDKLWQVLRLEQDSKNKSINIYVLIVVLIIAILLYKNFYNAARQKSGEAISKIKNEFARKLHDDIGASLSFINIYIDQKFGYKEAEKDYITAEVYELIEKVRSLSFELRQKQPSSVRQLFNELSQAVTETFPLATPDHVQFIGQDKSMSFYMYSHLMATIKECLNNTVKHSNATAVTLLFDCTGNRLKIIYTDNGHGAELSVFTASSSLQKIKNHIRILKGNYQFFNNYPVDYKHEFIVQL